MFFWRFISLGLAGILDLAAGMLIVTLMSEYFSYQLVWWQYVIGAFLAASPDIDLLLGFFGKDLDGHHEYLTHRPIVGIPLAITIGWIIGGEFWALASGIGVFWHYLHDTQGFLFLYDNGLGWFWPFSRRYWGMQRGRVVSRTPKELSQSAGGAFDCLYECYLTPTRRSITEFVLTSIFFGCVLTTLWGGLIGIVSVVSFWGVISAMWLSYRRLVLT